MTATSTEEQKDTQNDVGLLDSKENAEEDSAKANTSTLETTASTVKLTEPEPEEEDSAEKVPSKYELLDRLFKFVRTRNTPLNSVLAGYFTKLVTLLINRKQKQLIPYIFAPG